MRNGRGLTLVLPHELGHDVIASTGDPVGGGSKQAVDEVELELANAAELGAVDVVLSLHVLGVGNEHGSRVVAGLQEQRDGIGRWMNIALDEAYLAVTCRHVHGAVVMCVLGAVTAGGSVAVQAHCSCQWRGPGHARRRGTA